MGFPLKSGLGDNLAQKLYDAFESFKTTIQTALNNKISTDKVVTLENLETTTDDSFVASATAVKELNSNLGELNEELTVVKNHLDANIITSSQRLEIGKQYTATSDGYLMAYFKYNTNPNGKLITYKINGFTMFSINPPLYNTNAYSLFVKKGMTIEIISENAEVNAAYFFPLS